MFSSGGIDRLAHVLQGWARIQRSEVAESAVGMCIVPNSRSIIYPSLTLEHWQRYLTKNGAVKGSFSGRCGGLITRR